MATLQNTYQNLNFKYPTEGVVYKQANTDLVMVNKAGTIYLMPTAKYTGDVNALPVFQFTGEAEQALASIYGSVKFGNNADPSLFATSAPETNPIYKQTISPDNPQGVQITSPTGEVIKSPSLAQSLQNAQTFNLQTGGQITPPAPTPTTTPPGGTSLTPQQLLAQGNILGQQASQLSGRPYKPIELSPVNIPGQSTESAPKVGKTVTLPNGQQVQIDDKGNILGSIPTAGSPSPSPSALGSVVQFDSFLKTIQDKIDNLSAGIPDQSKILEGLFQRFGLQDKFDAVDAYNQIILDTKKIIKDLPDAIKESLQDVGVTQAQLTRLQAKEIQPKLEALNEAMAQAGATQDSINNSLRLVGMFQDAASADIAARFEIAKFQIQTGLSIYGELKEDQRAALNRALTEQTNKLELAGLVSSNGAPQDIVNAIINSDFAIGSQLASRYLSQATFENYAKGLANTISGMSDDQAAQYVSQVAALRGYDPNALLMAVQAQQSQSTQNLSEFESAFFQTYGTMPGLSDLIAYNKSQTSPTKLTEAERATAALSGFSSAFTPGAKYQGIEVIGTDGNIDPRVWKAAIADAPSEGLSRKQFIEQFGYLINITNKKTIEEYGLTATELKLITGEL